MNERVGSRRNTTQRASVRERRAATLNMLNYRYVPRSVFCIELLGKVELELKKSRYIATAFV